MRWKNPVQLLHEPFVPPQDSQALGGIRALNGKLYTAPLSGVGLVEFDPVANTVSSSAFAATAAMGGFNGATLLPDGRIVMAPHSSSGVLIIDPKSNSLVQIPLPKEFDDFVGVAKFSSAVLVSNQRVLLAPFDAPYAMLVDTFRLVLTPLSLTGRGRLVGGADDQGRVFLVPVCAGGEQHVVVLTPQFH